MFRELIFALLLFKVSADSFPSLGRSPQNCMNFPDLSQQPQRCFSWAEVGALDGARGAPLCLVIEDRVYNVTDFLPCHVGGRSVLAEYGGRDASAAARASGMPPYVYTELMQRFLVGYVAPLGSTC